MSKPKFTREGRYYVLKNKDIEKYLSPVEINTLHYLSNMIDHARSLEGRGLLSCAVVESDWPEYEPTWQAIEARVNREQ